MRLKVLRANHDGFVVDSKQDLAAPVPNGTILRLTGLAPVLGSNLIAALTLASTWGRWRLLATLAALTVVITAWNVLVIYRLSRRIGYRRGELIRVSANIGYTIVVGHLTDWTLANWLWLPLWGLTAEGMKLDRWASVRFAFASVAVSVAAVVEGVSPSIPISFCAIGAVCYAISSARETVILEMLVESDVRKQTLAATNEELSELPRRIQTSILPKRTTIDGLQIEARMVALQNVGGDYYDVLPARGGSWIGIGDVAGHGLQAGLIMMMVQSTVAALTRAMPDAPPAQIVALLNEVLFDNIRDRLGRDEHVTFSLLRQYDDGRVDLAGAHEDIVVWRAESGTCETIATQGGWLGVVRDVRAATTTASIRLRAGDLLVLYTDGITEARDAAGEEFGLARLCRAIESKGERSLREVCDQVLEGVGTWSDTALDDRTLVVVRYDGPGAVAQHRSTPQNPATTDLEPSAS
jgi:serine phosphatase RsbU (regulator of sigma subunit)